MRHCLIVSYRLASPQILMPYNLLFKNFIHNSSSTNHAIVKMLHRIAVDLKFPEMLFQLSTFLTFRNILHTESKGDKVRVVSYSFPVVWYSVT